MDNPSLIWAFIAVCVVLANLPFFSGRIFWLGPRPSHKALGWRLVEWAILCAVSVAIGRSIEAHQGQIYPQGWEFYAAYACLFATFAFPGFVWRYLRRGTTPAA